MREDWVETELGEILEFNYGKGLTKANRNTLGNFPVYGSNGIVGNHDIPLVNRKSIIIGRKGTAGAVHLSTKPCWPIDTTYFVTPPRHIDFKFTYYLLRSIRLNKYEKSTAIPGLNRNDAYSEIIPLPLPNSALL